MKTLTCYSFSICFLLTLSLSAQDEKGSWQIGVSGSPLFQYGHEYSNGFKGVVFSGVVSHSPSQKTSVGLMPYFGSVSKDGALGLTPGTYEPWGYRKETYTSFGLNLNLRYYPFETGSLKPYAIALVGPGKTYYHHLRKDEAGNVDIDRTTDYNTLNIGLGVGVTYEISETLYLDLSVMYSTVNGNNQTMRFLYPQIGIVKKIGVCK